MSHCVDCVLAGPTVFARRMRQIREAQCDHPGQCSRDLVKNGIDDLLRVLEMQVRILFCQAPNQSRFEREPLPSQKGSQARATVVKAPKNPAQGLLLISQHLDVRLSLKPPRLEGVYS